MNGFSDVTILACPEIFLLNSAILFYQLKKEYFHYYVLSMLNVRVLNGGKKKKVWD